MPRLRRPRSPVHALRQGAALLLLIAALVLALRPDAAPATPRSPATVPVAVAARDLPAGTVLAPPDLRVVAVPGGLSPAGTERDVDPLVGRALAAGLRAGEPVTDVRLVGAGLTALLPPDRVAIPVRLADLGVATLVRTGDRVDVLATAPGAGQAEVVAAGALVLAAPEAGAPGPSATAGGGDTGLLVLAVDPTTASRLAARSTSHTLTVSLGPP